MDFNTFKNPTAEYRGIPFWSWNCKVTKELIDSQLDCFKEMGFGGVDVHPRVGLDNEYLGEEFMELIRYTADKCREKGLICWLYDDDRYPSGAADGIVTKNVRYRDRGLLLTTKKSDIYLNSRTEFEAAIDNGDRPKGYFLCAYALDFKDGILKSYKRLNSIAEADESGSFVRYAYVKLANEGDAFEGQTYVDTLNPGAIDEFIRVTHDKYYDTVGDDFGKTVQAIFTDEPRIGKETQIDSAESEQNFEIPYSEYFDEFLKNKYGMDMLDVVPELVWDTEDDSFMKKRHIYRDALAECFTQNYMDKICDWCTEHNILMTGHVLSEMPLIAQSATVGECMRSYRNMDIPGVDVLCDDRNFTVIKQASSVSKQLGRQGTMSELYGVTNWDCTFKTYKLQGDWQAALGITIRVPHLSFMSMAGEGKRDWPASIFYQSPWYKEFAYIEDYFARVNYFLSMGKPVTRVAVVHSIESAWLHLGQKDKNEQAVNTIQKELINTVEKLLYGTIDFDFISESMLPGQCGKISNKLQVGVMEYDAVVVPMVETMRSTTIDILGKFRANGGKVIFTADAPCMTDAVKSDRAEHFAQLCGKTDDLLSALESERDIQITCKDGRPSDNLFYQLRADGSVKRLFICNVRKDKAEREEYTIRINGVGAVKKYNAQTGEAEEIHSYCENGFTYVLWNAYGEDSLLLELDENGTANSIECGYGELSEVMTITKPESVSLEEKNVLLLDYVRYSIDGGALSERAEILKADALIRSELGFLLRNEHMRQPWATEEKEYHKLKLFYEIYSETETEAQLGIELPPDCKIRLNGEEADMKSIGIYVDGAISVIRLPKLKNGRNELTVEMTFNQKTNIESMYLLGDFGVKLNGNTAVVTDAEKITQFGDITAQGMPFYTGNIDYMFSFEAPEDGEYYVRIPEFKAPVTAVSADDGEKSVIAYSPHRGALGYLKKGTHRIKVRLYGNRFNCFGVLHNADTNFKWLGPKAYRTSGYEWTDNYMVRPVGIMSGIIIEKM